MVDVEEFGDLFGHFVVDAGVGDVSDVARVGDGSFFGGYEVCVRGDHLLVLFHFQVFWVSFS